ncbi:MAG TPA: hypothetical protein VOB72_12325 [Candidatus Dormibacteraeota bacterium]|nr:hypothetical protein [Candidatus Dormibacteraeota bacterium]
MDETLTILSPVPEPRAADAEPAGTAGLPDRVRVGLLSNGKPNTSELLDGLIEALTADVRFVLCVRTRKETSSRPAAAEILDRLAAEADLVVGATAD